MSIAYSPDVIKSFMSPKNLYIPGDSSNYIGFAGDDSIGEYVHLYFQVNQDNDNLSASKILSIKFSAIGGVSLITTAEKFCDLICGLTFLDALNYCDVEKVKQGIGIPDEKIYSVNFVIQAFYSAFEALVNVKSI